MKRYAFLLVMLAALALWPLAMPALASPSPSMPHQAQILFTNPVAPDSVAVSAPSYLGSTEWLLFTPLYTTSNPTLSIQQYQWQYSLDGGSTWKGPDGTSATYYTGPAFGYSFTSGSVEARCWALNPTASTFGASQATAGPTASANQTYSSPPSGSGTVNSGTSGQVAYYASTGTAVSGETTLTPAQTGASAASGYYLEDASGTNTWVAFPGVLSITGPSILSWGLSGGTDTASYATGLTSNEYEVLGVNGSGAVGLYPLTTAYLPSGMFASSQAPAAVTATSETWSSSTEYIQWYASQTSGPASGAALYYGWETSPDNSTWSSEVFGGAVYTGAGITSGSQYARARAYCLTLNGTSPTASSWVASSAQAYASSPYGGSGASSPPFPTWTSGTAYTLGQVVQGSDNNLYRCISGNTASSSNNPVWTSSAGDNGTYWQLYYLAANIALNTGSGNQFAGTSSDPAGIQQAVNFVANATPGGGTCTISVASNPTATVHSGSSTTSFTSASQFAVGTVFLFTSGTSGNIDKSCAVTAVSGPSGGFYTYTVSNTYGTTGLSSTPAASDGFTASYGYGTNTINVSNVPIGPWLTIQGSTSTVAAPTFYPSLTSGTGSLSAGSYFAAVTYTWSAGGQTWETMAGPVTSLGVGTSSSVIVASFTLPTGATGANLYVGESPITGNSGLHKQGAFSVSGGVASAYTLSSYSSSGANPPTANPIAPAYPVALTWGNTNGVVISGTNGLTWNGFYCDSNSSGSTNDGISILSGTNLTLGTALVVSNWGSVCILVGNTNVSSALATAIVNTHPAQVSCASAQAGPGVFGIYAFNSQVTATNTNALSCSNAGISSQYMSSVYAPNAYVGGSGTGLSANRMSNIESQLGTPGSGTAQQTFGTTTTYSPTVNSAGNSNSYISNT